MTESGGADSGKGSGLIGLTDLLGPILLGCGTCGLLGLWYAGRNIDRSPR